MVENREFVDNIEARAAEEAGRDLIAEQITTRTDVIEDMEVLTSDGQTIGTVREVRATHFLIDRSMSRDVWAPFSAVADVTGERVLLNVEDIDALGWEHPPLIGNAIV